MTAGDTVSAYLLLCHLFLVQDLNNGLQYKQSSHLACCCQAIYLVVKDLLFLPFEPSSISFGTFAGTHWQVWMPD